jgi:hypothetical protein
MGRPHRLMLFENRMLRYVFRPKRTKWQGAGNNCKILSFILSAVPNYIQDNE